MKKLVIFKEKDYDRIFIYSTADDLCNIAKRVLRDRLDNDNWYGEESVRAFDIWASGDRRKAWNFLLERSSKGYEYESIDFTEAKEIEDVDNSFNF